LRDAPFFIYAVMKPIDDNHITVKGWMVSKMKLKGNKLLAYALIYGFSQDGQSTYKGSISYVTRWLNCARSTAIETLEQLEADGWIKKTKTGTNGIDRNEYKAANVDEQGVVRFPDGGSTETGREPVRKPDGGSPESGHKKPISNSFGSIEGDSPAQFHVQLHSLETVEPAQNEYTASAPDWMDVAREMAAYAEGEGKTQWQFMAEVQGYKGAALPIVSNWASKASPWQLKNWKTEFRKLQTWLKTEARADAAPAIKRAMQNNTPAPPVRASFTLPTKGQ